MEVLEIHHGRELNLRVQFHKEWLDEPADVPKRTRISVLIGSPSSKYCDRVRTLSTARHDTNLTRVARLRWVARFGHVHDRVGSGRTVTRQNDTCVLISALSRLSAGFGDLRFDELHKDPLGPTSGPPGAAVAESATPQRIKVT